MNPREVIISEDAFSDLEAGRLFYDGREAGADEYFVDSLIADLESLLGFIPAFTSNALIATGCFQKDFHAP